jgi:hypothetical protein
MKHPSVALISVYTSLLIKLAGNGRYLLAPSLLVWERYEQGDEVFSQIA